MLAVLLACALKVILAAKASPPAESPSCEAVTSKGTAETAAITCRDAAEARTRPHDRAA